VAAEGILALRYARALFLAATQAGVPDEVGVGLRAVAEVAGKDPVLSRLLALPFATREEKRRELVAAAGGRGGDILARFLAVLVQRRREALLDALPGLYDRLLREARGVLAARVQSAFPLTDDQRTRLAAALGAVTGKTVQLEEDVRPRLLGGIRVFVGDTVYDGTLRRRLQLLGERWIETKV